MHTRTASQQRDLSPSLAIAMLLADVLLTFWPLCGYEFVSWDDVPYIAANPHFANPGTEGLAYAWTQADHAIYIPLTRSL
jgi:hypothetical protein